MISFHPVAYSPPSGLSSLNDALASTNNALAALVKTISFSDTTTSTGNVSLPLTPGNSAPIIAYDSDGNIYQIRRGSSSWVARVTNASGAVLANTNVSVFIKYLAI